MAGKTCQICGKPSGIYPLCFEHLRLKKEGKVVKNEKTNTWELKDTSLEKEDDGLIKIINQTNNSKTYDNCIICTKNSNKKPLCLDCYKECNELEFEFDKNRPVYELKDYYFSLKSANFRTVDKKIVINNLKKMYALANIVNNSHSDTALTARVVDDIEEGIKNFESKKEVKITSFTEQSDSQKSSVLRSNDGHVVKSRGELVIDNILYNNNICHAYEKEVNELSSMERTIKSDFYIPINFTQGVYLEYWGMTSKEYLVNKEDKRKKYKEHKLWLIEIEKDDINDPAGLENRIRREYKHYLDLSKKN